MLRRPHHNRRLPQVDILFDPLHLCLHRRPIRAPARQIQQLPRHCRARALLLRQLSAPSYCSTPVAAKIAAAIPSAPAPRPSPTSAANTSPSPRSSPSPACKPRADYSRRTPRPTHPSPYRKTPASRSPTAAQHSGSSTPKSSRAAVHSAHPPPSGPGNSAGLSIASACVPDTTLKSPASKSASHANFVCHHAITPDAVSLAGIGAVTTGW